MYKKLEIKNPCNQNWDDMRPVDNGRHCSSCNKVIHDFSQMNDSELLQMLQSGKYSCGMFTNDQMGTLYKEKEKTSARKKYWSAIAASILAGTLQLSVSYGQTQTPVRKNAPVVNRSTQEKFFDDKSKETIPENQIQKEKFSFRVVDSETKQPLEFVRIEMMGLSGTTDSLGRIDFTIEYTEGESKVFTSTLLLNNYEEEKIKLNLKACFKKLTVLYLKRKKEDNKKYMVLGGWG